MIPRFLARKRAIELGLFDPEWYRKAHVDVSLHGMDPFKHYIRHGWLEGRNASPVMGEDFVSRVIPDCLGSGRNPVMEVLSRIRRGEFTEAALAEAMTLHEKMPKCGTRLLPGITVAGFFGRSTELGELARTLVLLCDRAGIPCTPFNVLPAEGIQEPEIRSRCRQVMDRRAAIFVLDQAAFKWATRCLRPGRFNVLLPCGITDADATDGMGEVFDEIWVGDQARKFNRLAGGIGDGEDAASVAEEMLTVLRSRGCLVIQQMDG